MPNEVNNIARITNDQGRTLKITALEINLCLTGSSGSAARNFIFIQAAPVGNFDITQSYLDLAITYVNAGTPTHSELSKSIGNYVDTLFELDTFNTQQTEDASFDGQIFLNALNKVKISGAVNIIAQMFLTAYYRA